MTRWNSRLKFDFVWNPQSNMIAVTGRSAGEHVHGLEDAPVVYRLRDVPAELAVDRARNLSGGDREAPREAFERQVGVAVEPALRDEPVDLREDAVVVWELGGGCRDLRGRRVGDGLLRIRARCGP